MPTLTGSIADILGTQFDHKRTAITVTSNAAQIGYFDGAGELHLGGARVAENGTFSITLPSTAGIDGLAYFVSIDYPDPAAAKGRGIWTSGWFALTADATLADVASIATPQAVPIESLQVKIDEAAGNVRTDTEAAAADAQASKTAAATSATNAATSETNAAGSATAAAGSASEAADSAAAAEAAAAPTTTQIRSTVSGDINTAGTDISNALNGAIASRFTRNILDFGVQRGTAASQTAAIKSALDAHPGEPFYFPPGDYRLDTGLTVTHGNSIYLEPGARIYAGAAMDTLIDWDNGATGAEDYAQDCFLVGQGVIDANLNASAALAIGSVIRFSLGSGLTIVDPINRGLHTKSLGAEVFADDLRIHNTGSSNVSDNIAIEAGMSDCHFSNIVTRDFTVGVYNRGAANVFDKVHPWIGDGTQLAARFADSIAFIEESNGVWSKCYADTYRKQWQIRTAGVRARIVEPRVYVSAGNLTDELAAANPATFLDFVEPGLVAVTGGHFQGHSAAPLAFTTGNAQRLFATGNLDIADVSGVADYKWGVQLGVSYIAPSVKGSAVAGAATYTNRGGTMEVRDGHVSYNFWIFGTFDDTIGGDLLIDGLALPAGAVSTGVGVGSLVTSLGASALIGGDGSDAVQDAIAVNAATAGHIDTSTLRGQDFTIYGQITCPFAYPS